MPRKKVKDCEGDVIGGGDIAVNGMIDIDKIPSLVEDVVKETEGDQKVLVESKMLVTGGGSNATALGKAEDENFDGECAFFVKTTVCSGPKMLEKMREYYETTTGVKLSGPLTLQVRKVQNLLEVESESGILEDPNFRKFVGKEEAEKELVARFKVKGFNKYNPQWLLDNDNIDYTLSQWSKNSPKLFNKKFYHIPFQMIDFQRQKSELANIDVPAIIAGSASAAPGAPYDCMACVLNTDISSGRGKHWFCIYGDFQHKGTIEDPLVIEFFNSSGNRPMFEMQLWLEKTRLDIQRNLGKRCIIHISVPERLQYSRTECGMWCLMYIKYRLQGKPSNYFATSKITDEDMMRFRKMLFR